MKYLLPIIFLSSCTTKPEITAKTMLYQPSTIILEAGKPIETADGTYVPKFKEVWHSAKKVEELEKQLSQF
jgi:hypothetical protein